MANSYAQSMIHSQRASRVRLISLGILLLGFALRVYRLDAQELRGDEAFGYFFSLHHYADIIQDTIRLQEPHPVASYFLQHLWLQSAGHSVYALRFSSTWFNLLAVALLYRLANSMKWPHPTALWAAFLLAISPYALWHAQDARMYSMSMALTIATVWAAIEWLQRQRFAYAVAYVLSATLALYTHYYSAYVLLALYVYVLSLALYDPRFQNSVINLLSPLFFIVLFYSPWYERIAAILQKYRGNGDSPGFVEMVARAFSTFAIGQPINWMEREFAASILIVALFGALCLHFWINRAQWRTLWLLLLYLFVPLLVTWFGSINRPIFNERYLVTALPPLLLLVATGQGLMTVTWQRWRSQTSGLPDQSTAANTISLRSRVQTLHWPTVLPLSTVSFVWIAHRLVILSIVVGMVLGLNRYYFDENSSKTRGWQDVARLMIQAVAGLPVEQSWLVQTTPNATLWYYTGSEHATIALPPQPFDQQGAIEEVEKMVHQGVKRVALAAQPDPNWDDQGIAQNALATHFTLVVEQPIHDWTVQVFDALPETFTNSHVIYANQLELVGFALQPASLSAGGVLATHLQWKHENATLTGHEKVSLQLLDANGQLVAQEDRPLLFSPDPEIPCSYGILLPEHMPAGEYRLLLVVYDPEKADAPRILTVDGVDAVQLTTLSAG